MIDDFVPESFPKVPPIMHIIEQRAGVPVVRPLLRRHYISARGSSGIRGPAVVFDGCFECRKAAAEFAVSEPFNVRSCLGTSKWEKGASCKSEGLFDRVIHQ